MSIEQGLPDQMVPAVEKTELSRETPLALKVGDLMVTKTGTRRKILEFDFTKQLMTVETTKGGKTFVEQLLFKQVIERAATVNYILDPSQQTEAKLRYQEEVGKIIQAGHGMDFGILQRHIEREVAQLQNQAGKE